MEAKDMIEMMADEEDSLWEHRMRRRELANDPEKSAELQKQKQKKMDRDVLKFLEEMNVAAVSTETPQPSPESKPELESDSEPINYEEDDRPTKINASSGKTIVLQNINIKNLTIHLS